MAFTAEQGLKRRKAKKPRNSKEALSKFYGLEPIAQDYNNPETNIIKDMNWYSEICDRKEGQKWLLEYLKSKGRESDIKLVRNLTTDDYISSTICWQARMMMNGSILTQESMDFFNKKIDEFKKYQKEVRADKDSEKAKVNPADRVKRKNEQIIQEYEGIEDDLLYPNKWSADFSLYNFIIGKGPNPTLLNWFKNHFAVWFEEMKDPEFNEGRSKEAARNMKAYVERCISDIDSLMRNKQVERKARKPKSIPVAKLVQNMEYMPKYDPLQLVSISPESVIGKSILWAINVKHNSFMMFKAAEGGFSAKGKSLCNVDLESSVVKRLRKPHDMISEFMGSTLPAQRKWLTGVKSKEYTPSARISKDIVLLKAV